MNGPNYEPMVISGWVERDNLEMRPPIVTSSLCLGTLPSGYPSEKWELLFIAIASIRAGPTSWSDSNTDLFAIKAPPGLLLRNN